MTNTRPRGLRIWYTFLLFLWCTRTIMAIIFVECIHELFLSYCNEFTNYTILYLSEINGYLVTSARTELASSKIYYYEKPYKQNGLDLTWVASANIFRHSPCLGTIVTSDKIHKTPYLYADWSVNSSSKNEHLGVGKLWDYWDMAIGPRNEIQGMPILFPTVLPHMPQPILLTLIRSPCKKEPIHNWYFLCNVNSPNTCNFVAWRKINISIWFEAVKDDLGHFLQFSPGPEYSI